MVGVSTAFLRRRVSLLVFVCGFALLLAAAPAFPTTVIPPTFDELVDHATTIFVGETVSRRSQKFDTRDGPMITTLVTFTVVETLKGSPGAQMTLEFMGGTVGADTLVVSGMPQFNVGDHDVVFVGEERNTVSPLVGFAFGRFRIARDANGIEGVRTFEGRTLVSTAAIGRAQVGLPQADTLSLATFKNEITRRVRAATQQRAR